MMTYFAGIFRALAEATVLPCSLNYSNAGGVPCDGFCSSIGNE